jgi:hypothetical protein
VRASEIVDDFVERRGMRPDADIGAGRAEAKPGAASREKKLTCSGLRGS